MALVEVLARKRPRIQNLIEAAANFVDTNGTIDVADLKKWAKSTVEYPNVTAGGCH